MTDGMIPRAGTLWGVPEHAVAHVLYKIGVAKIRNNVIVAAQPSMWDDFMHGDLISRIKADEAQVKTMMIKHTLMKIVTICDTPNDLRKACMKNKTKFRPPMVLGARPRSLKVIKSELLPLIKNAFAEEFKDEWFNHSKEPAIDSNGNGATVGASVNKNEEVVEVDEDVVPNALSRIIPNEITFPVTRHFRAPVGNEQYINNLLAEPLSNKEHEEGCFSVCKKTKR